MSVPNIETPRLRLRGFQPGDFPSLCGILSDRDVVRYMPRTDPWPEDVVRRWMDDQRSQWRRHGLGWWALECKSDAQLIGWCGLGTLEETSEVEVLYLLGKSHWGRGLATEAARVSIERGFRKHGLGEIIGLVHPENAASRRVLEKCGLRPVDTVHYFGLELLSFRARREDLRGPGDGGW